MTSGESIKLCRKLRGMTQKQLADILGVPYQSIGQWETGIRNPKLSTLARIAAALDVEVGDLLGGPQTFSSPDEFQAAWRTLTSNPDPDAESLRIVHGVTPMTSEQLQRINAASNHMTAEGIAEAVERFCEVSEIPKYQQA